MARLIRKSDYSLRQRLVLEEQSEARCMDEPGDRGLGALPELPNYSLIGGLLHRAVKDRGVWRQTDFQRGGRPHFLAPPQIAELVTRSRQTEITPAVMNSLCRIANVEDCDIDALILSETTCEIIEYKTGQPKQEHKEQVRLYNLLWARDSQLNPSARKANRLSLAYTTGDIAVQPLADSELDILEQTVISRTDVALQAVRPTPPPARPSIQNCSHCSVRQLCSDY